MKGPFKKSPYNFTHKREIEPQSFKSFCQSANHTSILIPAPGISKIEDLDPSGLSPYHKEVAARKETKAKTPAKKPAKAAKRKPWGAVFWMGFFILVFGLFMINKEAIHNSIESIKREMNRSSEEPEPLPEEVAPAATIITVAPPAVPAPQAPAAQPTAPTAAPAQTPAAPARQTPAAQPAAPQAAPAQAAPQTPASRPAAPVTRDRALYFTQVDREGTVLRIKTTRKLPQSDSPMEDALKTLLAGPETDELRRGLITLIPKGTRILNTTVRGSTAYISLSEDFQLNTHGVEGYAASLRQIVWTVTEFSNVKDVQILVEGRRVDYLGEGIWIGSPLDRETVP
jgi:spore germination protein GerM